MITSINLNAEEYDAIVLKVGERWYICDEAQYDYKTVNECGGNSDLYIYYTQTLKFELNNENGYICTRVGRIEIIGWIKPLKLVYL